MEVKFSIQQIADIAKKLRTYKKLTVTTRGQMFKSKIDADEAVRTLNMIIEDTNEYVGVLDMSESMVTDEKLKQYGKDTTVFDALFKDAKIPVTKSTEKKPFERKREKPEDEDVDLDNSIEAALKGVKKAPEATKAPEAPKAPEQK